MAFIFNGTTIPTNTGIVRFNGIDCDKVVFNGATVWELQKGPYVMVFGGMFNKFYASELMDIYDRKLTLIRTDDYSQKTYSDISGLAGVGLRDTGLFYGGYGYESGASFNNVFRFSNTGGLISDNQTVGTKRSGVGGTYTSSTSAVFYGGWIGQHGLDGYDFIITRINNLGTLIASETKITGTLAALGKTGVSVLKPTLTDVTLMFWGAAYHPYWGANRLWINSLIRMNSAGAYLSATVNVGSIRCEVGGGAVDLFAVYYGGVKKDQSWDLGNFTSIASKWGESGILLQELSVGTRARAGACGYSSSELGGVTFIGGEYGPSGNYNTSNYQTRLNKDLTVLSESQLAGSRHYRGALSAPS